MLCLETMHVRTGNSAKKTGYPTLSLGVIDS